MWHDDLDTAFRHLDLYDRFGCPGGHVQATFRCLTRFGAQIDDKVPQPLDGRIHACWINPGAQPQAAAAAAAPSPATAGNAAPRSCRLARAGALRIACAGNEIAAFDLRAIGARNDRFFSRLEWLGALKTPRRHTSC